MAKKDKKGEAVPLVTPPEPVMTIHPRTGEAVKPTAVDLKDFNNGKGYKNKAGEEFGLKIVPAEQAEFGHTHLLKNNEHSWAGTEEEFKLEFEKK